MILRSFCECFIKKDEEIMIGESIPKCFIWGALQGTIIGFFILGAETFLKSVIRLIKEN